MSKPKEDIVAYVMEHADPAELGAIGGLIIGKGIAEGLANIPEFKPLMESVKKHFPKQ